MKKPVELLPNKPSALLRIAVADCRKARRRGIKEDMFRWVAKTEKGCFACMAGAVMLCSLKEKIPRSIGLCPSDNALNKDKLLAINALRVGELFQAIIYLGIDVPNRITIADKYNDIITETYNDNKGRAHWRTYLKAADYLESVGL